MSESDPAALSPDQVAAIQDRWDRRVTIASLAYDYGVTKEVIRHIISLPRHN